MAVATTERDSFVSSVHKKKQKIFKKMMEDCDVPLRAGVVDFIESAVAGGARIAIFSGTQSNSEDDVIGCVSKQLGKDIMSNIRVFTCKPGDELPSFETPKEMGGSVQKELQGRMAEVKRKEAEAFVNSMANLGVSIEIDPKLGHTTGIQPSWFAAVVSMLGTSLKYTVVVAANYSTIKAAAATGAAAVAVPSWLNLRGSFPEASAVFDGFGPGGGLTWDRVVRIAEDR